ncbi:MAG: protein translocase subunit SecD, partial [Planctomycetales bacterium]
DIVRAIWVSITDPEKAAAAKKDKDLVTRTGEDGLEQLIIVGQELARWVEVGVDNSKGKKEYRITDDYMATRPREDGGLDGLVLIDTYNVTGANLKSARTSMGETSEVVSFTLDSRGAKRFGKLTSENVKESGRKRHLSILLDEVLLSAPELRGVIRDRGQITGNFSKEELDWLVGVLEAGSLPAALNKDPISRYSISPTLGEETIKKGTNAIVISLVLIVLFMPFYYRFCGMIACFALVLNLCLVLGMMLAVDATFTLAGMAGLVLTVGMAVDANVLIFERIREELDRGAALRMAIRNGFGRATRTIVDANLTTLITAIVLYAIGKDQLRGFAVTLILGIGMSMFTAIFCSRVIFDIAEKRKWITKLSMVRILGKTNFNFIGKRNMAFGFSALLIIAGMVGVYLRGAELLDTDFSGGHKVEVVFKVKPEIEGVRVKLLAASNTKPSDKQLGALKVTEMSDNGVMIETTQTNQKEVEQTINDVFLDDLQTQTLTYDPNSIKVIPDKPVPVTDSSVDPAAKPAVPTGTTPDAGKKAAPVPAPATPNETPPANQQGRRTDLPDSLLAQAPVAPQGGVPTATDAISPVGAEAGKEAAKDAASPTDETPPPPVTPAPKSDAPVGLPATPGLPVTDLNTPISSADLFAGGSEVELKFSGEINKKTLEARLDQVVKDEGLGTPEVSVTNPDVFGRSSVRKKDWKMRTTLNVEKTKKLLKAFQV